MSNEQVGGVSEELDSWLSQRASETGHDPEEVLARAVATYRLLSETDASVRENGAAVDPLDDRLDELGERLDRLESATDENVTDVRNRVVQVLKTAQSKADADHDHAELDARVADAEETLAAVEATVETADATLESLEPAYESLESDLAALENRVDGGFENYEAILEGLTDDLDDADSKLDTLASAVVDLRERTGRLEAADARREAVEDLQAEANRLGVGVADCEECGFDVDLGLLAQPRCPQCATVVDGIDPGRRFFGRATLTVGERPALEGGASESTVPEDVFEDGE